MPKTVVMQKASAKNFPTRIGLSADVRSKVAALLNQRLADSLDLRTQVKHAHWNVKGIEFQQLHELFDEIATHLEEHIDLIAERITALGGVAHGTVRLAAASSSLPEYDLAAVKGEDHVLALVDRVGRAANAVRDEIDRTDKLGDKGTSDLLTEVSRQLDKDLWFLEAHLQA
jgi:starvation-inducible DNA-binding protein